MPRARADDQHAVARILARELREVAKQSFGLKEADAKTRHEPVGVHGPWTVAKQK